MPRYWWRWGISGCWSRTWNSLSQYSTSSQHPHYQSPQSSSESEDLPFLSVVPCITVKRTRSGCLLLRTLQSLFICPIAIAYSMGQIIKSFCVCPCVCVCVYPSVDTLTVAFLSRFSPNLTQTCKPPKVRMSSLGVNIAPPLPLFSP